MALDDLLYELDDLHGINGLPGVEDLASDM